MADLLVQNASAELNKAITASGTRVSWSTMLGAELRAYLKAQITAFPNAGPYYTAAASVLYLCDLSDPNKVANCTDDGTLITNFAGATTQSTGSYNTKNIWTNGTVLAGGAAIATATQAEITTLFTTGAAGNNNLKRAYTADNAAFSQDVFFTYMGLQSEFTGNATILKNWFNVEDAVSNAPGKRLSETNYLKVCGAAWQNGVGGSCTWTVPAGATQAKFQAWGAGKGSNPACCCGGSSWANSGTYSEMTIKVTAADTYTVCAGCSCQIYGCSNAEPGKGCMSGVVGNGICCFKADGSNALLVNCGSSNSVRVTVYGRSACQRHQNPYCTSSGPCFCGCGEYCFDSSCGTCGVAPILTDCCQTCFCSCATDACVVGTNQGPKMGYRSMYGATCIDTNNYGFHVRPPMLDSDTGSVFPCSTGCYCQTFSSSCCCGGCNGKDWTTHPGAGGAPTHVMGGNTNHKGDTGKGGMVQISWT